MSGQEEEGVGTASWRSGKQLLILTRLEFKQNFHENLLECAGHSFAYVAHLVYLTDVWIRTQRAAVAKYLLSNKDNFTRYKAGALPT